MRVKSARLGLRREALRCSVRTIPRLDFARLVNLKGHFNKLGVDAYQRKIKVPFMSEWYLGANGFPLSVVHSKSLVGDSDRESPLGRQVFIFDRDATRLTAGSQMENE